MLQDKLKEIIEQPKQALIWAAILGATPFLHWLALLFMLVITLRKGLREGLMLAAVIALLSGIVLNLLIHLPIKQVLIQMLNPIGLCLLAWILRETSSWENVLQALTLVGMGYILFLYSFYPISVQEWTTLLIGNLQQVVHENPGLMGGLSTQSWQQAVQLLSQFAVGLRIMLTLVIAMIFLIIARYVQAILYNPGGLKRELYHLRLNFISGVIILVLIMIALLLKNPVWLGMLPIFMFPFIFTGLSLLHYLTAFLKYQWIILTAFYIMMTILPYLLAIIVLLGACDALMNIRKRSTSVINL